MYELLLRVETLFLGLQPPVLLAIGGVALVVGLVLWLAGSRYSAAITGLLGAVVGSAAGLLIGQRFGWHPLLSMLIGAAILATLAILLRKVLILVLAVVVIGAVSGAGYISVMLDRVVPAQPPAAEVRSGSAPMYQSFSAMAPQARLSYMDDISNEADTFGDRLKALLDDTWNAIRPHGWVVVIAVVAGAIVGLVLVWFIAKVVIALAYSIVGAAAILLGVQAVLLAVDIHAVSALDMRRWLLPIAFVTVVVIGWVWQLFFAHAKVKPEPRAEAKPSE